MWSKDFWKATAERAINTLAQVFVASIGVGAAISDINWGAIASVAGVAALISVLKSVVVNTATGTGPSIVNAEQVIPDNSVVVEFDSLYGQNEG